VSRENPSSADWARYYDNHPQVLANSREPELSPGCTCPKCDPDKTLPRPNILAGDEARQLIGERE
jgi:hypothetical protein